MEPAENTVRQRQPGDRQDELLDPAVDAAIRAFLCTRNGRDVESRPQSSKRASRQDAPPVFAVSK